MDNANDDLSKHLHEVLDVIGASEYVRMKYREYAMLHEITAMIASQFNDATYNNNKTYYQVGSTYEGTTTPGLNSDSDELHCCENSLVIDNLVECKQQGKTYLLLIDDDTKPGYVRLQIILHKCPLSVGMLNVQEDSELNIDRKGRLCLTHQILNVGANSSRNGPADTRPAGNGYNSTDCVYALRCRHIPRSANKWLHRKREYEWPSQIQLRAMGAYGCFLVGVGHPHSDNKTIEWRISFSLQERDLMSSLNETQHKCYILLKMIKKDVIASDAGESISSYHLKTILFYTIENSPKHIWKDGNLILCARLCLIRLLMWVKNKNCPNYFIPEKNMFDKLSQNTLETVEQVLNKMVTFFNNFLYKLTCDNLGEELKYKICGYELVSRHAKTRTISRARHLGFHSRRIYSVRNDFLRHLNVSYETITGYMNGAMQILLYLQHTNHVTEHTTRDVRMALDSLIPHVQLQYEQCLFSQYVSGGDLSCMRSDIFQNVILGTSSDFDLISSKLALASLYIQYEELKEKCQCILVACANSLEPYVISECGCYAYGFYSNPALAEKLQLTDMSSKYFRRHCTTCCMVFLPTQVDLVDTTLQYELFRNVYTKPGSEFEMNLDYWLNWITVDSQIYLYFLQYLLYSINTKNAEKETALLKLMHVLKTDPNLGHKETALNLCGWICLREKNVPEAWRLFCLSWKIRPFKNAAKWHMLILLSEVINRK